MSDTTSPFDVAPHDSAAIAEKVRTVVAEVLWLSATDIDGAAPLIDYGLDSPTSIDLTVQLERVFDVSIPEDVAIGLETVDQIVAYVREQRA
ncbi:acyl carrier protein [Nocardia sp. NPDC051832]|uniref:acyl carrier protein n=1 Tax=Nocardia sp. NPDC051832 TaxID=3155673 RepID=UPI00341C39C9